MVRACNGSPALSGGTHNASRASACVYWADNNTIERADLNGTGSNERFINAPRNPLGVAVASGS